MAQLARGCRDIHANLAQRRRALIAAFSRHVARYGFHEIETPILEHASLYDTLGGESDIVAGEMYAIKDTSPALVLRPEGTAGVARALASAGPAKSGRNVWYAGPMFRRERPQRGRFRQFWQLGVESVGDPSVIPDVDVIEMADVYLRQFADVQPVLRLNTLGTKEDRMKYNTVLREFLTPRKEELSSISKRRLESGNVMRILDSKLESDISAMSDAPLLHEFVGKEEHERFNELKLLLTDAEVDFRVDEKLVRGLDYYTSTAFEFDGPCGRAVCAGGRYVDVAGASGVGFAIGLDRIEGMTTTDFEELSGAVVVVALGEPAERGDNKIGKIAQSLVRGFRRRGFPAVGRLGNTRLGKSVTKAVKAGAAVVVVVGEDEVAGGFATVKFVRKDSVEEPLRVGLSEVFDVVCGGVSENEIVKLERSAL